MANSAFDHSPTIIVPGSTTDNAVVRWDGTGGKTYLNSGVIIADTNAITGITALTVDNLNIDGNTLTATSGAVNITPAAGSAIVLDGAVNVDAGVVTGVTALTATTSITLNARGELRLADSDSSHYIALESPATVGTSYVMALPAAVPSANDYLKVTSYSGGAGVLEWATAGGTTINGTTDNAIITYINSSGEFQAEAKLTFNATNSQLKIDNTAGSANFDRNAEASTGQIVENWSRAGTAIWQWGIDSDGSSNQKASNSDFAWYNNTGSGVYKIVFSHATGGIGTAGSLAVGGATIPTSGAGIAFPATQSASTNVNTLDDYEEGTWTPVFKEANSPFDAASMSVQHGKYVKIGMVVYITGWATTNGLSSMSTTDGVTITGLPFQVNSSGTSASWYGGGINVVQGTGLDIATNQHVSGYFEPSGTLITLKRWGVTTGTTAFAGSNLSADGSMMFSGFYLTST